ncbi:MAG TPA: beta-ketoacyl synthase chain length factor [Solimonas sp.]|nr:beta-ketoacyl synthase chain length factor [Solimonas sp.]
MIEACIHAIGLAAPGLPDWPSAERVLSGGESYQASELGSYAPQLLPANERRRATPPVRMAFRAAEEAVRGRDATTLATVFASSDGDMGILHRISSALTTPERLVSPTDFHNSVHNAAAGYWGIGTGSRAPSTTLAGYDNSFALGLIEAATQVATLGRPVLLVVFDVPAAEPLLAARPMALAASCALWLAPVGGETGLARLRLELSVEPATPLAAAALEALRTGAPALRALPLLRAIALGEMTRVLLPNSGGRNLAVDVLR